MLEWKNQKKESEFKKGFIGFLKLVLTIAFASILFFAVMGVLSNLLI